MSTQNSAVVEDYDPSFRPLGLKKAAGQTIVAQVTAIEKEHLSFVKDRLIKKQGWNPSRADEVRIEFLRFISLSFVNKGMHAPSAEVDEFWHAFLLFTREYHEFCQRHFGKFVHHVPEHSGDIQALDMSLMATQTRTLLGRMFPDYSREIWGEFGICSKGGPSSSKNCGIIIPNAQI